MRLVKRLYLNQPDNILTVQFVIHDPTCQVVPLTLLPSVYRYSVFSHLSRNIGLDINHICSRINNLPTLSLKSAS